MSGIPTSTLRRHAAPAACGVAILLCLGAATQSDQPWAAGGITRVDLQRHDLGDPGREMVQVRVDFAPGAAAPPHRHPGEEIVYMLSGSLEYRVEGQAPTVLGAGEVLFIPRETTHAVRNVGEGDASELATYVVDKGRPLLIPAP